MRLNSFHYLCKKFIVNPEILSSNLGRIFRDNSISMTRLKESAWKAIPQKYMVCEFYTSSCLSDKILRNNVQNLTSVSRGKIFANTFRAPVLLKISRTLHSGSSYSHFSDRSHPCVRFSSSALFITSDKLSQLCPSASPVVDVQSVLDNEKQIIEDLNRRKHDVSEYDFTQMHDKHKEFVSIEETIKELDLKIVYLEQFLRENRTKLDPAQIEQKKAEIKELKGEVKKFDSFIVDYQKNVILQVLKLPNKLDERTPLEYEIISEYKPGTTAESKLPDALERYVKFSNRLDIHYLDDAAEFEFVVPIILKQYFSEKQNFVPFTNTDLCKGVIVEGCGTPYLCPYDNIVLVNNENDQDQIGYNEWRYHLVGSGAMEIFCAYHTNHSVNIKDLPVKSVTSGKTYGFRDLICSHGNTTRDSVEQLYNSLQKETINLFIGTNSAENLHTLFVHLQTVLESVFQCLHLEYRLCKVPAHCLHSSESLRVEFQLFSPRLNAWVTCGEIGLNNGYISKRLAMCYHSSVTSYERNYLHVLNANVFVNVLLVHFLENNRNLDVDLIRKSLSKLS